MTAVLYTEGTTGLPGGPTIYLCAPCSSFGASLVKSVTEGDPEAVGTLLLRIHHQLTQLHAQRFDPE